MNGIIEFNQALKQNVDAIADRVRELSETPWIVVPSTEPERVAFVKEIARTALSFGLRDHDASVPRDGDLIVTPRVTPSSERDEQPRAAKQQHRWTRVEARVGGETVILCVTPELTPRQVLKLATTIGLITESAHGDIDWVDPQSIVRLRVQPMTDTPPSCLQTLLGSRP